MAKTIVTTTTTVTTTTITEEPEVTPKKSVHPWEDFNHETHYWDQVNEMVRPKTLNPGGRCQNCGSVWSCWC